MEMTDTRIDPPLGVEDFSSPSFHRWAFHYYKCRQDFQQPHKFSPVPYALLCRVIELELKSRLLKLTPRQKKGTRQQKMRNDFGHNLEKAYKALPADQKVLTDDEREVLRKANAVYDDEKGFDYIRAKDAGSAYKRFPDPARLDAVAKKLLQL
jgi:hypothetical protein